MESSPRKSFSAGKFIQAWFSTVCACSTWFSLLILGVLLLTIAENAFSLSGWLKFMFQGGEQPTNWLDWQFLTSYHSYKAENAGLLPGLLGTLWVIGLTIVISIPTGVGAAIYLEEYAPDNWLTKIIRINLANLAGVPSIVYGMLGLTVFVHCFGIFGNSGWVTEWMGGERFGGLFWIDSEKRYLIPIPFGKSVISGALTLSLLILPVVIVAAQEALRAVPPSLRHASLALGATRWQTIRHQILPAALPGILTGIILAISRAMGETAPLIMVGAAGYVTFAPGNIDSVSALSEEPEGLLKAPFDSFSVIPIQIFTWVRESKGNSDNPFSHLAAAGIIVLLIILLLMNGLATYIRYRFERYHRW